MRRRSGPNLGPSQVSKGGEPQFSGLICAQICARDAAGWVETGETPKLDVDQYHASAEVSAVTGDRARRWRRLSYGSYPRGRRFKSCPRYQVSAGQKPVPRDEGPAFWFHGSRCRPAAPGIGWPSAAVDGIGRWVRDPVRGGERSQRPDCPGAGMSPWCCLSHRGFPACEPGGDDCHAKNT